VDDKNKNKKGKIEDGGKTTSPPTLVVTGARKEPNAGKIEGMRKNARMYGQIRAATGTNETCGGRLKNCRRGGELWNLPGERTTERNKPLREVLNFETHQNVFSVAFSKMDERSCLRRKK